MVHCGWRAEEIFNNNPTLKSLGATSKAAYLISSQGEVVIISFDTFISPLTCTINQYSPELRAITPGEVFEISPDSITHDRIFIQRTGTTIWREPAPAGKIMEPAIRFRTLLQAARIIDQQQTRGGFSVLLLPFLELQPPVSDGLDIYAHIMGVCQSLINHNLESLHSACLPLIGLGRGLTPSGDDVLNGLLLYFNRWPGLCPLPPGGLEALNQIIRAESHRRTTSLSANLLELACQGSGDERLVSAVDGLITGSPGMDQWLPDLLSYGSSSGGDALLGMAIAIRSGQVTQQ